MWRASRDEAIRRFLSILELTSKSSNYRWYIRYSCKCFFPQSYGKFIGNLTHPQVIFFWISRGKASKSAIRPAPPWPTSSCRRSRTSDLGEAAEVANSSTTSFSGLVDGNSSQKQIDKDQCITIFYLDSTVWSPFLGYWLVHFPSVLGFPAIEWWLGDLGIPSELEAMAHLVRWVRYRDFIRDFLWQTVELYIRGEPSKQFTINYWYTINMVFIGAANHYGSWFINYSYSENHYKSIS